MQRGTYLGCYVKGCKYLDTETGTCILERCIFDEDYEEDDE